MQTTLITVPRNFEKTKIASLSSIITFVLVIIFAPTSVILYDRAIPYNRCNFEELQRNKVVPLPLSIIFGLIITS